MIPIHKKKAVQVIIAHHLKGGGPVPDEHEEEPKDHEMVAEEIIHAIELKDPAMLANALFAMMDMYEQEPHEEGPHLEQEE